MKIAKIMKILSKQNIISKINNNYESIIEEKKNFKFFFYTTNPLHNAFFSDIFFYKKNIFLTLDWLELKTQPLRMRQCHQLKVKQTSISA